VPHSRPVDDLPVLPRRRYWLLLVPGIALVLGSAAAALMCWTWLADPGDSEGKVAAGVLVSSYLGNHPAADADFTGHTLQVDGWCESVDYGPAGGASVYVLGLPGPGHVRCDFPFTQAKALHAVRPLLPVTVRGVCRGVRADGTVVLSRCRLVPQPRR
jgi:hypothetical protein